MTVKQMWQAFLKLTPEAASEDVEAWCYGGQDADLLAELTGKGIKTATSSAYPVYLSTGESLPRSGCYSIVMRTDGEAVCVVYTTRVYVVPFHTVSEGHAWREGEGDRGLDSWRSTHRAFFAEALEKEGFVFNEDMDVVCEEFVKVFPAVS